MTSASFALPRPSPVALAGFALFFAAAGVAAWFANGYYVFIIANMALTAIVGIGLNVLIGLTGQVSFGHVGFYAIGAYAVAILTTTAKLSIWFALPVGALLAGVMGGILALPALRVRGPYLAMVTIAFGFMVEHGAVEWRAITGGQNGIMGVPPLTPFGINIGERSVALAGLALAALLTWMYWRLVASPLGRAMRAVKDTETAAESIGLNPVTLKAAAFAISAVCAGLAGGLFSPLSGFVTPSTFAFSQSILFVLVVMIGGAGTVAGPLVGALIVVLLPELLAGLAEYRLLFFGALMLVVLWIAPSGIVGAVARLLGRQAPAQAGEAGNEDLPARDGLPELRVEGLGITFGGVKAVTALDISARPGMITALIGPNGAGKTTVLNMLSGFYRPGTGSIALGTAALAGRPAWAVARAGIARTYQTSQLFGSLSVLDNLVVAQARGRVTPPFAPGATRHHIDAAQRGAALARFVGYGGDLARTASDLPHVDRRLIEIARALATKPAVLLLDEPAAGLSSEDKGRLGKLLQRIAASGVAVVLVEHDMGLVMGISQYVVVIDAGVRIAAGTPAEVQQSEAVKKAYLGAGAGRPRAARSAADSTGQRLLEVGKLGAGYGTTEVLHDIALTVREREMVAVLGANGAGKSTLMRALSGLIRPVSGGIDMDGRSLEHMPAHKVAALGMVLVPEGRQVFPELTVVDNIRLGAFLRPDSDAVERDVESMFVRFPRLKERMAQRAGLLSGGEQQMLAIARGLMAQPRLLLLDEPSLGLAPAIIEELFAALDRLRDESVTILLVDQMAALALALADRAYVIEGGRIVASGSAQEIAGNDALERAYLGG
jgi:ABC-type branched-subunit amino acid transport system ATPase component/ABC-type branched-subunit amino acid transport system permease subunit